MFFATKARRITVKEKKEFEPIPEHIGRIASAIVDAAYHVHKNLVAGFLEKVHEVCLCHELNKRGISTSRQIVIPIKYDGLTFDEGLGFLINFNAVRINHGIKRIAS